MIYLDQLKTDAIRVIHGSVKDIYVLKEATDYQPGEGIAVFSDRISVFDWGPLPFEILNKGASLCLQSAIFFEQVQAAGKKTHYLGLIDDNGRETGLEDLMIPTNMMKIALCQVKKPVFKNGAYDYSGFDKLTDNFVIATEFLYRLLLPTGASVFKRLKDKTLTLQALNLDHHPVENEKLPTPFIELTTKMEEEDRPISWDELMRIYNFEPYVTTLIKEMINTSIEITTKIASRGWLTNCDGKFEFAFINSELAVVDAGATMDECRFAANIDGEFIQISKEIVRRWYAPSDWKKSVDNAKKIAKEQCIKEWQSFCPPPPPIPQKLSIIVSNLYMSVTNAFLGRKIFDCPDLNVSIEEYRKWSIVNN